MPEPTTYDYVQADADRQRHEDCPDDLRTEARRALRDEYESAEGWL